jgi:5-methylcytosine-specific restriction endonuclease McrA
MSIARYYNPRLRARILTGSTPGWLLRHPRRSYIVAAVLATPPWADRDAIKALRDAAREATRLTGVEHVLDHIVPLNHPYVCGLMVPWNLQIMTRAQNAAKSNRYHPDQLEMFTWTETTR